MSGTEWSMREIDLETFQSLDQSTRSLVLRLLGNDDIDLDDYELLGDHPNGSTLSSWLLKLPAYQDWTSEELAELTGLDVAVP